MELGEYDDDDEKTCDTLQSNENPTSEWDSFAKLWNESWNWDDQTWEGDWASSDPASDWTSSDPATWDWKSLMGEWGDWASSDPATWDWNLKSLMGEWGDWSSSDPAPWDSLVDWESWVSSDPATWDCKSPGEDCDWSSNDPAKGPSSDPARSGASSDPARFCVAQYFPPLGDDWDGNVASLCTLYDLIGYCKLHNLYDRPSIHDLLTRVDGSVLEDVMSDALATHPLTVEDFKLRTKEAYLLGDEWIFGDPKGDILEDLADFILYLLAPQDYPLGDCDWPEDPTGWKDSRL